MKGRQISDQRFQVDALDGLRGMAVLLVILSHTSNADQQIVSWLNFSGIGKSGVFLFFTLSAFLLTYPFVVKGKEALTRFQLANYFVRRFFRIYPLYFLYLLAAVVSTAMIGWWLTPDKPFGIPLSMDLAGMWRHLSLQEGKGVTWSIAVEFQFYFVLPVLVATWVLLKRNLILCCAVVLAAIVICYQLWPPEEVTGNDVRLGPYMAVFLCGSMLALLQFYWRNSAVADSRKWQWAMELMALFAFTAAIITIPSVYAWVTGTPIPRNYFHHSFIMYAVIWGAVLFGILNGVGYFRRCFEWPPLRYMGFISFSAYLVHPTCVGVMAHLGRVLPLPGVVQVMSVVGLTVLISMVSFKLIESPSSRIKLQPKKIVGARV
ncbi:acyltransferase family protein [Corallincola platygyrae]|uniref:Acyltransferase family protein n=1 Tax=Corallincola platygyrae TaxID=1193278 RepID=A0ABW4XNB8_9GAMM